LAEHEPFRLWQIRTFPFDPNRRLSSAVVLVQLKNLSYELWKFVKGSPDSMKGLFLNDFDSFDYAYTNKLDELERSGLRCIAMGAENLSKTWIREFLFPSEFSADSNLSYARSRGKQLHQSDVESLRGDATSNLTFCGFSCFDAAVRPSSKRVVAELHRGGLTCMMLTGDSMNAALNVAKEVGIIQGEKVAVLDVSNSYGTEKLVWRFQDSSSGISNPPLKSTAVNLLSVKKMIDRQKKGRCSLVANGRALEKVLNGENNNVVALLLRNIGSLAVIARATPELKKNVVETLRCKCGKLVMMCGKCTIIALKIRGFLISISRSNSFEKVMASMTSPQSKARTSQQPCLLDLVQKPLVNPLSTWITNVV
jgi:magnesium-transporting ATPase (P-type)